MRNLVLLLILLAGCSNPPPLSEPPALKFDSNPKLESETTPEKSPKSEPEKSPEQIKREIAAYQKLLDRLLDMEKEVNEKMKLGRAASFLLSEDDEIAMRSGEIFLSYLAVVKKDIRDKIQTLQTK
jgi:hypothetical protein